MEQLLIKLNEYILNLDYFNDIIVEEKEVKNVELDATYEPIMDEKNKYAEVPLEFVDIHDYNKVWEPLFFIESKANILKCIQAEVVDHISYRLGGRSGAMSNHKD